MQIRLYQYEDLERIIEIFFENSSIQKFENDKSRKEFFYKYCGYYLENYSQWCFVAIKNNELLGYICCCPDSAGDRELKKLVKHYELFSESFIQYPAHLHINLSSISQGQGIGGSLLRVLEQKLQDHKLLGVHLITSSEARNKYFYQKNSYNFEHELDGKLLMGKSLTI